MMQESVTEPELSNAQKKKLRAFGHHLNPLVQIGKEGITPSLVQSSLAALKSHELIKVKIGQNAPVERHDAAIELAALTAATLVQQVGKVFLLYRPNPDLPAEKRITL